MSQPFQRLRRFIRELKRRNVYRVAVTYAAVAFVGFPVSLSGDVQRMGDQIQVNVSLVDPETDTRAWTNSYRRDMTANNLFAIQTDITKEVGRSLEARLTPEEAQQVERQPTEDLDAHHLYVRVRNHLDRRTEESMQRAVRYLPRALNSLRASSGYEELIRTVNTSWGLNPDGSLPDSAAGSLGSAEI